MRDTCLYSYIVVARGINIDKAKLTCLFSVVGPLGIEGEQCNGTIFLGDILVEVTRKNKGFQFAQNSRASQKTNCLFCLKVS